MILRLWRFRLAVTKAGAYPWWNFFGGGYLWGVSVGRFDIVAAYVAKERAA